MMPKGVYVRKPRLKMKAKTKTATKTRTSMTRAARKPAPAVKRTVAKKRKVGRPKMPR
jgi:hypothetical protein